MTRNYRTTPNVWSRVYTIPAATAFDVVMDGFPRKAAFLEVVKMGVDGGDMWGRLDGNPAAAGDSADRATDGQEYMPAGNITAEFEVTDQASHDLVQADGSFTWSCFYVGGGDIYVKVREAV